VNRTKVRTGRFLLYFFISAIVITAAGTITAVFLFPTERLIDMVSRSIEERTGFTPAIGNIQPGLGRVIVTNTTLFAKKSKQPVLIARSISLGFSWIKLFTGTMEITDIIISKSTIELRFMKHGMTELEKLLTDETGRRSKEKGTVAVDLKNITFKKCLVKVIKPTGPYKPLKGE
jgi:uncharacterized protein involved in outer membrane biogenesis